jgi:hypothetical protein
MKGYLILSNKTEKGDNIKMRKFTLEQAVHEYGNLEQIKGFEKVKLESKKGKGNLKANNFIALERTIQQHFEDVKVEGKGSNRIFICDGELEELKKREDFRINNGNRNQNPYKEDIRKIVLNYLIEHKEDTFTLRRMLEHLNIVDSTFSLASKKYNINERKAFYKNLDDKYKEYGHAIFWDVVQREHRRLSDNLKSVLDDLVKSKLIKKYDMTFAVMIEDDKHERISYEEAKDIYEYLVELREKNKVTLKEIMFSTSEDVRQYKQDEKKYLESLGIKYIYDGFKIIMNATKKEMERFNKNVLSKELKQKHLQRAYEKALEREEKENQLLELLGGKMKKESENQELNEIKQEEKKQEILTNQQQIKDKKLSKCYADEYKSTLINLNFNDRQYN